MPAASIALIFSAAEPDPPEMIAPAWPIRRPGGAVCPAMNAATGLGTFFAPYSGPPPPRGFVDFLAPFSAPPPLAGPADLADQQDRLRLRIGLEQLQTIDLVGPW